MNEEITLLVDIGNSAIKWCSYVETDINATDLSDKLVVAKKVYPKNISQESKNISQDFFLQQWGELTAPDNVVVSSVANSAVLQALQQASNQLWSLSAIQVTSTDIRFPFLNAYQNPAQLGDDRFCAMVAAYHNTDTDYLVVDCGSALTIDIVASLKGEQRTHQGGYVLPGLSLMKASLAKQTADVRVDKRYKPESLLPGDTTEQCVDAAIYLSAVSLIESVFKQQHKENITCILTGGDAEDLAKFLSIKHRIIPNLVLQGLVHITCQQNW